MIGLGKKILKELNAISRQRCESKTPKKKKINQNEKQLSFYYRFRLFGGDSIVIKFYWSNAITPGSYKKR